MKEINKLEVIRVAQHYKMDPSQRAKQFAPFDALEGFRQEIHKKEADNLEFNGQLPISVVASFSDDGHMIPVYFTFEDYRIHIDNIKWEANGLWGRKYRCEITDNERVKTVDLFYYKTPGLWKLKML